MPLNLDSLPSYTHPGKVAYWLRDTACTMLPALLPQGQWQPSREAVPNFGYSHDCNWLWLRLYNGGTETSDKLLHIEKFHLNEVRVVLVHADGSSTRFNPTGVDYPFDSRQIIHRHYLFPLRLEPADTADLYIMLRNDGSTISAPISIYDSGLLYQFDNVNVLGMGFMSGFMALIVVFNFLVFLSIRDRVYLFYSLYTLAIMLVIVNNQGYLFQYVWPSLPWMANLSRALLAMSILYGFIRLGQYFLNLSVHYPRINMFLQWVGRIALIVLVLAALLKDYEWARRGFIISMQAVSLIVPMLLVLAYVLYYKLREHQQLVYIIAFTPAIIYLIVLNLLIANGLLPVNEFYFYGLYVFIIFEVLVLSTYLVINLKRITTEKSKLLQALNQEQSRQFSVALEASEGERKRIARELHDGLGQLLSTIKLYVSGFDESLARQTDEQENQYQNTLKIIDEATQEVRHISHNLMPSSLIQLGLVAALQGLARKLNGTGELKVWLDVEGNVPRMADTVEISVYRIAQEIVNNIIKHAHAQNIWIKLIYNGNTLTLHVKDDGIGMDTNKLNQGAGIGWSNIFSRVTMLKGEYQIFSAPQKGTIVEVTISPTL